VRVRAGAMCLLRSTDDELSALLGDRELRMPAWLEPAMQVIVEHGRFPVSVLTSHLAQSSRIVLIRRLVAEGLLEVVE
jgi:bifunctional lysine-specific demethylase and histidyl-hydroxylase NO66